MGLYSTWSNFKFLPPLSHTLSIHSYSYSLAFCLYTLEKSCSYFGVYHPSSWVTLFIIPLGACWDLSLVFGLEEKKSSGGWSWGEPAGSCKANTSGEAIQVFSGKAQLIPSDSSGLSNPIGEEDTSEFKASTSSTSSGSFHASPFQF